MKIMFIGDVHGEFYIFEKIIELHQPDMVIQCGDFGFWPTTPIENLGVCGGPYSLDPLKKIKCPIYFCDGNHEDHDSLQNLPNGGLIPGTNTRHMKRGSVLELANGKTILFMGGARSVDKSIRQEGVDWFADETISYVDMRELPDRKIDIVVSHTCPNVWVKDIVGSLHTYEDKDPSREALQQILELYHPSLWIFGHWHHRKDGDYKDTHWVGLDMIGGRDGLSGSAFYYLMTTAEV